MRIDRLLEQLMVSIALQSGSYLSQLDALPFRKGAGLKSLTVTLLSIDSSVAGEDFIE